MRFRSLPEPSESSEGRASGIAPIVMAASPAVTGRVWISWQQPTGVGAEPALYTHTGGELCFVVARVVVAGPAVRLTKWLWADWAGSGLPVNGGGYRVVGKDLQEDRPRLTGVE